MSARYHPYRLSCVPLAAFLLGLLTVTADEPAPPDAGITIEARGPVHEAYAQPVTATPQPGLIVNKQPPGPIPEEPPEQKPALDDVIWVPGYWAWDTDRNDFLWVSGFWRVPPDGRRWLPGYWNTLDDGWQWVSGFWVPAAQEEVTYVPEPPASVESGPSVPAPDDNSTWVPGNWVWRTRRFAWRPGFWFGSQEGLVWTPATYYWTPCGYAYSEGYQDYPLADRGLLFAPVLFTQPLWTNPEWSYTPNYCVDVPGLLSSFWVRPSYGHYYFGDYYGAGYARQGFSPWLSYGPRHHDPLYGYYRSHNAPGYFQNLNAIYAGRNNGDLVPPGRTLAEHNHRIETFNSNTGNQHAISGRNQNALRTVNALSQMARSDGNRPLAKLTAGQRTQEKQRAQSFHDVRQQRSAGEQKAARGDNPLRTKPGNVLPATHVKLPASAPPVLKPGAVRPHERPVAVPGAHVPTGPARPAPPTGRPGQHLPGTTLPAAQPPAHPGTPAVHPPAARPAPAARPPAPLARPPAPARPAPARPAPARPAPVARPAPRPAPVARPAPRPAPVARPAPAARPATPAARPPARGRRS